MGVNKDRRKRKGPEAEFDKTIVWKKASMANDDDTAGGVANISNPTGTRGFVDKVVVDVTTAASDSSCTLDMGIAADASTSDDTLIDGLDVNSGTGVSDNVDDQGTNGNATVIWDSGDYFTASVDAGSASGLEGNIYVRFREE